MSFHRESSYRDPTARIIVGDFLLVIRRDNERAQSTGPYRFKFNYCPISAYNSSRDSSSLKLDAAQVWVIICREIAAKSKSVFSYPGFPLLTRRINRIPIHDNIICWNSQDIRRGILLSDINESPINCAMKLAVGSSMSQVLKINALYISRTSNKIIFIRETEELVIAELAI